MAELPGHRVEALDGEPVDAEATAAAGAQDHREDDPRAGPRAVHRFGKGQAVSIVGEAHGTAKCAAQVFVQGAAVQPGAVGVADQPGLRRDRAGDSDPDLLDAHARLPLGFLDQLAHLFDGPVVVDQGGLADAGQERAVRIDGGRLDLAAAEVDSDADHRRRIDPGETSRNQAVKGSVGG